MGLFALSSRKIGISYGKKRHAACCSLLRPLAFAYRDALEVDQ